MMISYNISRQYLPQALLITPGKRAATVSPLEGDEGIFFFDIIISAAVLTENVIYIQLLRSQLWLSKKTLLSLWIN